MPLSRLLHNRAMVACRKCQAIVECLSAQFLQGVLHCTCTVPLWQLIGLLSMLNCRQIVSQTDNYDWLVMKASKQ